MPIGPVRGYPVGNARALIWTYVQSGTYVGMCTGQQDTLTAGATSGAYVWNDVKSTAFAVVPPTDLQIQGGDKIVATATWGGGKLAPFDVTGSSIDTVLNDLIGGGTTNNTNAQVAVTSPNPYRTSPKTMGFASQQQFLTSTGLSYFITRVVPRASLIYRSSGMTWRGESDSMIHVSSIVTQKAYNGQVYGSTGLNLGLDSDSADYVDYITANPIHIMAFRQDASTTTFTTTYRPLSSVVTVNDTSNSFSIGGTITALTSISTTTGVATLTAAGTTGIYDVLQYETAYVPV
jgi:hypothetical protein